MPHPSSPGGAASERRGAARQLRRRVRPAGARKQGGANQGSPPAPDQSL